MRALVFLLVLANLLFLAYAQGFFGIGDNPDRDRIRQQLAPEKVRILARGQAPADEAAAPSASTADGAAGPEAQADAGDKSGDAAKEAKDGGKDGKVPDKGDKNDKGEKADKAGDKAAPKGADKTADKNDKSADKGNDKKAADPKGDRCLVWNGLAGAQADKLAALGGSKYAALKAGRSLQGEASAYWVYIPPLASRQEAEHKAEQLKALQVPEYFIVQDGASRNAISLGIFSSEQAAKDRLEDLKKRGVRSAKTGPKTQKGDMVRLEMRGPAAQLEAFRTAAAAQVGEIKAVSCDPSPKGH